MIDGAHLLARALKLHLVDLGNARERTVEVLHLLAVAGETLALLVDLAQHVGEALQRIDIFRLCLDHLGSLLLCTLHIAALIVEHSHSHLLCGGHGSSCRLCANGSMDCIEGLVSSSLLSVVVN